MARRLRRCVFPPLLGLLLASAGLVGPGGRGSAGAAVADSTGVTSRVSVKSGGAQSDARGPAGAGQAAISDDGLVVAFTSDASNLVPGDTNGVSDVFVSQNGAISRVSLGPNFTQADGPSFSPAISHNGQYVAFVSAADNLVPGDTNGALDVFVYDRSSSTVTRVSVADDGSQANGDSRSPSIDDSGLVVAFTSSATNLVAGDTNGATDVFVRTLGPSPLGPTPSTRLVSVATGGSTGNGASDEPSLSADGTKIGFSSDASDLVANDSGAHTDVFWRDLTANPAATELVSLKSNGTSTQGNGDSFSPSLSRDGDQIAFASNATNLLPSNTTDTNDVTQVYVRSRSTKTVEILSQSCSNQIGDGQSFAPHITSTTNTSTAGVVFVTDATNLLQGCSGSPAPDNNGLTDVYFRALAGAPAITERVSVDPSGAEFNRPSLQATVSGNGAIAAFSTGAPDPATGGPGPGADVFARQRATPGATAGTTRLSAPSNGPAVGPALTELPAISADGTTVAYVSTASDLVTDDSNGVSDVFVYDRAATATKRVSVGPGGVQANGPSATDSPPAISADGQVVAFSSEASNLVADDTNGHGDVFVYDRKTGETARVSVGPGGVEATGGDSFSPAVSADGRYVAFASDATNLVSGDTNNATDVFVYDRQAKTTTRVSLAAAGGQTNDASFSPSLSADGSIVAFVSRATDLVAGDTAGGENVFVRDLKAGKNTRVSSGGAAASPALSGDGRVVAFASGAATLVPDDTNGESDVFTFDRETGSIERVSVGPAGAQGDRASVAPALSADGRFVAFASDATTLVPGDTNQRADVFVRDRRLGTTTRVSVGLGGQADRPSATPSISADGRFVAFQSAADNLVPGDTNSAPDIFVHDLTPVGAYWLVGADGGVFAYGSAPFLGSTGGLKLAAPVLGMAATTTGRGYWLLAADGGVFSFGDAPFFGSMAATGKLKGAIVGITATPTGAGYWLVGTDGGVFSFGDARFFGSTGGLKLARPIVGMAATPTGNGYWLVAADGGVFAFGDATYFGSTGALKLVQPVVGMAATPSGGGYWLVAADGGIFSFGDATFAGSTGGHKLNRPILGMAPSPTGAGYWMVAADGGVFSFGDAPFAGSAGGLHLARPVVGIAARR
jgi:Tol biopolymer transport system component